MFPSHFSSTIGDQLPHCLALALGEFQAPELDAIGADLGEVVMGLLGQPSGRTAAEDLGKAYRHFWRDPALFID